MLYGKELRIAIDSPARSRRRNRDARDIAVRGAGPSNPPTSSCATTNRYGPVDKSAKPPRCGPRPSAQSSRNTPATPSGPGPDRIFAQDCFRPPAPVRERKREETPERLRSPQNWTFSFGGCQDSARPPEPTKGADIWVATPAANALRQPPGQSHGKAESGPHPAHRHTMCTTVEYCRH